MASSKIDQVRKLLEDRHFPFSEVFQHPLQESVMVFFPCEVLGERVGKGKTSTRQLANLRTQIHSSLEVEADFISTQSANHDEVETVIQTVLQLKHPGMFRGCKVLFPSPGLADLSVDPQSAGGSVAPISALQLSAELAPHLLPFGLRLNRLIGLEGAANYPTLIAILRNLKVFQPSTLDELRHHLVGAEFEVPSTEWLLARLDNLRKQGMIVRNQAGQYAVTDSGMRSIPDSGRRASSDVLRALALGRKQWL